MSESEKRREERCLDEAGEPLTLFKESNSESIHGIIVDWSMNGLALVYVSIKPSLEIGEKLRYSPDMLNLVSLDATDNLEYSVARIKPLGDNIFLLGLEIV